MTSDQMWDRQDGHAGEADRPGAFGAWIRACTGSAYTWTEVPCVGRSAHREAPRRAGSCREPELHQRQVREPSGHSPRTHPSWLTPSRQTQKILENS